MKLTHLAISAGLALAFLLCLAVDSNTFAQGRGGGRPASAGRPAGAGQPSGAPGVDRGLGTASTRSDGRSDTGLGNASTRSSGRSTTGLDRARLARENAAAMTDAELNRFRGLARKLGSTPEEMRAAYEAALLVNQNLRYGQFVAAHMIAENLGTRFPGITSAAILGGLADGDSIGQTLRDLGVAKDEAKAAEREANRRIKEAKNRD